MKILKNCHLVKELTEGFSEAQADILLDGKQIKRIVSCGTAFDEPAEMIDLHGKTLLPGWIDLHTHLYFTNENIPWLSMRPESQSLIASINFAYDKMEYGYTTLRDCGGVYNSIQVLRDGINAGMLPGPRILASGRCITPTTTGNDVFGPLYREFNRPEEAREVARQEVALGADFIKYMATGAVLNPGGDPGKMITTRAELKALVEAANELHTYVAAHCHGKEGVLACVDCGVKTVEHATYADEECTQRVLDTGKKTAFIPTFAIVYAIKSGIVDGISAEVSEQIEAAYEMKSKNMKYAYDHGVSMGWGTDIDQESFDKAPFLEFTARREMGLDPVSLLKQATIESAVIAGIDNVCGTVKEGKDADLIVIDGRPEENFEDMVKKPVMVFAKGREFKR